MDNNKTYIKNGILIEDYFEVFNVSDNIILVPSGIIIDNTELINNNLNFNDSSNNKFLNLSINGLILSSDIGLLYPDTIKINQTDGYYFQRRHNQNTPLSGIVTKGSLTHNKFTLDYQNSINAVSSIISGETFQGNTHLVVKENNNKTIINPDNINTNNLILSENGMYISKNPLNYMDFYVNDNLIFQAQADAMVYRQNALVVDNKRWTYGNSDDISLIFNPVSDRFEMYKGGVIGTDVRLSIDQMGLIYFGSGTGINEFSTDETLADNSDDAIPTEKAVKTYIDYNLNDLSANLESSFSTDLNITSNSTGDLSTDDFVFGSDSLDDDGFTDHDNRFFFDKSKGAFRAGAVESDQWDAFKRGTYSFATGNRTTASGYNSYAEGVRTYAIGSFSHAQNKYTTAHDYAETTIGQFNISGSGSVLQWEPLDNLFSIGNGLDESSRHNAFSIKKNGMMTLNSGTSVNSILDEDDMASNSISALATQQSIKSYIDNNNPLNTWTEDISGNLFPNLGDIQSLGSLSNKIKEIYLTSGGIYLDDKNISKDDSGNLLWDGNILGLDSDIITVSSSVDTNASDISTISGDLNTAEGNISTNTSNINTNTLSISNAENYSPSNYIKSDNTISGHLEGIDNELNNSSFGPTANRPLSSSISTGYSYFDTDLGYPIWWNFAISDWVNATGAQINNSEENNSSGPTANRPLSSSISTGYSYFDTDLGYPIWWFFDISSWVNGTGAQV